MTGYVAMGSSYAAGPGIPPLDERAALRSSLNYAHLVAKDAGLQLTDVTCSGAITANLLDTPQRGLGKRFRPQIDAVTANTTLVTATVGGNDLGYIGAVTSAAVHARFPWLPGHVRVAAIDHTPLVASTTRLVRAIQGRAPKASVLLTNYLTVVGPDIAAWSPHLPDGQVQWLQDLAAAQSLAMQQVCDTTSAVFIDAAAASLGHGLGAKDPWVTGLVLGNPLRGGAVPFHPTADGMRAVADLILDVIR